MLDLFAFREFREGLAMMRDGEAEKATTLLRQAAERDPENPYYLSYYGLSLAYAEGKWVDAERLCHTAICRARRQAQLYLNLAEVYAGSGRKHSRSRHTRARIALSPWRHALTGRTGQACHSPAASPGIFAPNSHTEPHIRPPSPSSPEPYPAQEVAHRQRIASLVPYQLRHF